MRLVLIALLVLFVGCVKKPAPPPEPVKPPIAEVDPTAPLKLNDGRILTDWKVTGETADSVTLRHSAGISKVSKTVLPEGLLVKYPLNEALAKAEKEREAMAVKQRLAREEQYRQQDAAKAAAKRQSLQNQVTAQPSTSDRMNPAIKDSVRRAAQVRAERFFEYEYQPMVTNRILSFDVAIDTTDPEPWTGVSGLYTVTGRGYVKFYTNSSGFERATKEFRVKVEVNGTSANATNIELR
jgi:hypothetical protein